LLPIDAASSQAPEIAPEPEVLDHTAKHIGRIADIKGRVRILKQQVITAMDQADCYIKKCAASGRTRVSLEVKNYPTQRWRPLYDWAS
jgi:hypothetical protein